MDVSRVIQLYPHISETFNENSPRKNYFLATCKSLDEKINLEIVNKECPYGGIIGIGNSFIIENLLNHSKTFRLHAIFHDACGFMKSRYNTGPGYCYKAPIHLNSCFLGHVTGLLYCSFLRCFSSFYSQFCC